MNLTDRTPKISNKQRKRDKAKKLDLDFSNGSLHTLSRCAAYSPANTGLGFEAIFTICHWSWI